MIENKKVVLCAECVSHKELPFFEKLKYFVTFFVLVCLKHKIKSEEAIAISDFEEIYKENAQIVMRYLLSLTKDYCLAEELTQETFYRAYQNIEQFRGECKLNVWLCQIAKNIFINKVTKEKRIHSVEEIAELPDDRMPEKEVLRKEKLGIIYQAIHELTEPYKEVFLLHYNGEVALKEIGRLFGKSESWARVTYYRAREQLRRRIGKDRE